MAESVTLTLCHMHAVTWPLWRWRNFAEAVQVDCQAGEGAGTGTSWHQVR